MSGLRAKIFPIHIILIMIIFSLCGCCLLPHVKERKKEIRRMLVTAYDAGKKSCGWKRKCGCCLGPPVYAYGPNKGKRKKVGITSDGTKAKKGTIAADISKYPYGTRMHVPEYGWGEVHDTGSAVKGDHIDVFFKDHDDAVAWGRKYLDITIVR